MSTKPKRVCAACGLRKPSLKRPKNGAMVCSQCFFLIFETEIHHTITHTNLFKRGERVAVGASGGKGKINERTIRSIPRSPVTCCLESMVSDGLHGADSTVLAHVLKVLNERYDYGLDLYLLSVDEGITGYRDDSLETVKRNEKQYELPLLIVSYEELYGWTMDSIVGEVGLKNNCTYCGVLRRQALDRGAVRLRVDHIVTGHNADDMAETVLMNFLRGDFARLQRCTQITVHNEGQLPRSKPLKFAYEKEIVMYAYLKKLDYFSTECTYSPNAYRGNARTFLKELEAIRPSSILDIIYSGETFDVNATRCDIETTSPSKVEVALANFFDNPNVSPTHRPFSSSHHEETCERCGYMSSGKYCKACILLEGLHKGAAKIKLGDEYGVAAASRVEHSTRTGAIENKEEVEI
ncbi:nucleotidyltransferase [Gonapodya sp. JEL0774]|nr:nucleotidyltransferase [Gonapodya sp. JEL0774]